MICGKLIVKRRNLSFSVAAVQFEESVYERACSSCTTFFCCKLTCSFTCCLPLKCFMLYWLTFNTGNTVVFECDWIYCFFSKATTLSIVILLTVCNIRTRFAHHMTFQRVIRAYCEPHTVTF